MKPAAKFDIARCQTQETMKSVSLYDKASFARPQINSRNPEVSSQVS